MPSQDAASEQEEVRSEHKVVVCTVGKESFALPLQSLAEIYKELVEKRDRWLDPEGATEKELKKRTLTNLYNQRPTWLDLAHRQLDEAVLDAYGWTHDISDDEILEQLLALNRKRAGK